MEMQIISVGKRLPGAKLFAAEGFQYHYSAAGHNMLARYDRLSVKEIRAFQKGETKFGLLCEEGLVCIAYRFGREFEGEAMFTSHLVAEEARQRAPELSENGRAVLDIVLTDATSAIVRAIRTLTFSPEFSSALHTALRQQEATPPITYAEYERRGRAIQSRYPTTGSLMAAASVRCRGED